MSKPAEARRSREALVALGANLGDRLGMLRSALEALRRTPGFEVVAVSGVYDTAPVGPPDQPRYLNAAVAIRTELGPREVLAHLLEIERTLGRERHGTRWAARTIDLDLILLGECEVSEGDLQVPHPRFRERAFVLLPLSEIAPSARDPVSGGEVSSLLRACPGRSDAVRVGPLDDPRST